MKGSSQRGMRRTGVSAVALAALSTLFVATSEYEPPVLVSLSVDGPAVRLTPEDPSRTFVLEATIEGDQESSTDIAWSLDVVADTPGDGAALTVALRRCDAGRAAVETVELTPETFDQGLGILADLELECSHFEPCVNTFCVDLDASGEGEVRVTWSARAEHEDLAELVLVEEAP